MADNDNNGNNGEALPSSLETYVAAVTPTTTPTDDDDPERLLADHDFGADLRATIRSLLDEAHAAAAQETADDNASADGGGGAAVGALNVGDDGRTPSTHIAMSGGRTPATAADQVEAKAKRRLEAMVDRVAHLAAPPVGAIGSVGVPTTPGDSIEKAADADDRTRLRGLVEGIIDEEELPWELRANLKALRDSDYETFLDMPLNSVTLPSLINFLVVAQMAAGLEIDLGGSLPPVGGLVTGSADGGTAAAATTFWEASLRPDQAGDPQLDALRFRSVTVDGTITVGPHIDSLLGVDGAADPALILPGDHVYVHMHGYNNTEADVRGSFAGFNDALVNAGAPPGAKYIALQWNSAGSATAIRADVISITAATPIFRAFLETLVAHVGDEGSVVCSAHSLGTLALGGFLSDDSTAPLGLRAAYFFAGAFPVATARSGMAAINKHAARSRNYHRNKTGRYVDWVILGAWVIFGGGVGINAVQKVEKKLSKRHSDDRHVFSDRLVDFWMWSSGHTYYADPRVASDVVAHWLAQ